jgi:hypothetical protein
MGDTGPAGAPTNVTAQAAASPGTATVSWTAPSSNACSISSYTVTPFIGSTSQTSTPIPGSATSGMITGLTFGTIYTFTVTANNAFGPGTESAQSNAITAG